jgi:hypothetical protein
MSFFSRFKPAPPPVTNGTKRQFSQNDLNKASNELKKALSTIANQHVLKYANAIRVNAKAQANAARATAVAVVKPTPTNVKNAVNATNNAAAAHQNMLKTEDAAKAVVNAVPTSEPVPLAIQNAANAAGEAVARNAAANGNKNASANGNKNAAANGNNTNLRSHPLKN